MEKIKSSEIKGTFYPENKEELEALINQFKKAKYEDFKTRAIIAPHAGLIYSGELAYKAISMLDSEIKKVFIFAPAHKVPFDGISVTEFEYFETPLGKIKVDCETTKNLKEEFGANYNDDAQKEEHSIEIFYPLLQSIMPDVEVIPVLICRQEYDLITKIIEKYYDNKEYGFIISSDLSHFLNLEEAHKSDLKTANMIESGNLIDFNLKQACGAIGIAGLVDFANKKNYTLIRVGARNSSSINGDKERVVGYGAWALYEGEFSGFIKKYHAPLVLDIVKKAVYAHLHPDEEVIIDYPTVFASHGASFITIEKEGKLRGCIGSIIAHRALVLDLISNAQNSAYGDPRFKPVTEEELDSLTYAVSLLTKPVKIEFKDEEELLNKITEKEDGIIIRDNGKQAVYLPAVWEQLSDKKEFLNALKQKAGLGAEHFSETFEAYKFKVEYIK